MRIRETTEGDSDNVNPLNFRDWQAQSDVFDALAAFTGGDRTVTLDGASERVRTARVTADYFRVLGASAALGRTFSDSDGAGAPQVIVVNEAFAREFWPGESALGRRVTYNDVAREIVGVVGDVRRRGLAEGTPPDMFIPHLQEAWDGKMFLTVRAAGESADPRRPDGGAAVRVTEDR